MSPIHTDELYQALGALGLRCRRPHSEVVANISELSQELGWMLQDLPRDLVVPDPKGKRDLGFHLQPASAFEKRLTLLHDSKVLIFGHDGGGHVLFVSEIHEGKVGIVWEYPDDVFEMDFTPEDAPIVFWREEFLKWLQLFKTYGHDYLEEPGDEFE